MKVDPAAFGKRVAARRAKLGLSQPALAKAIGMKQQGINSIENGDVLRPRLLRELARELQTTEDWLLWRKGPEDAATEEPAGFVQVPLLSWVSAGKLADATTQIPVEDVPLLAFADLGRGEFFALTVDGDSMDRVSPEGSKIIVNKADRTLVTGRHYVFAMRGQTTYKQWQGAEEPPYLAPYSTNPVHRPIFIRRKSHFEVVGRVRRTLLDL